MHEVHRPHLDDVFWHGQRLWLVTHKPLARLDPQVELHLYVDKIHTLVIPLKAPDLAYIQVTQAKAQVAVVIGKKQLPVGHFDFLCAEFALIQKARCADDKSLAGHPYAMPHWCSLFFWPFRVCEMASPLFFDRLPYVIGLEFFKRYILFKRRLSSSSSFIRDII